MDEALAQSIAARRSWLAAAGFGLEALASSAAAVRASTSPALAELAAASDLDERVCLDGGLLATLTGAELERSLGLYLDGPTGAVIGGSWALPPELAAHVALRPLALAGPDAAPALGFGLPGGLPLAGISASGFAIVPQLLRPAALGPGLPGSAALRELLAAPRVERARALLAERALADGRNWMLADGVSFHGYEQLHDVAVLTRLGRKVGHVHANHCFDPALRQREGRPRSAKSFRCLELASTLFIQRCPDSAASMLEFFTEVEVESFADPTDRASCALAIELNTGRALWRTQLDGRVQLTNFSTPLRTDRGEPTDEP